MYLSILNTDKDLKEVFTFEYYNKLFSTSEESNYLWNHLWRLINYTKAYAQGTEIAVTLFDCHNRYKDNYAPKEQNKQFIRISHVFLKMLDKSDRWDDYLKNWNILYTKSIELKLGIHYHESSRHFHFSRGAENFFIEDTPNGFMLSYMYQIRHRKILIERKREKSLKSKSFKNLLHEQQDSYTQEEIKERYDWLLKFLVTNEYDFNPPASKQKEKRRKEKKRTIIIQK